VSSKQSANRASLAPPLHSQLGITLSPHSKPGVTSYNTSTLDQVSLLQHLHSQSGVTFSNISTLNPASPSPTPPLSIRRHLLQHLHSQPGVYFALSTLSIPRHRIPFLSSHSLIYSKRPRAHQRHRFIFQMSVLTLAFHHGK
jgi:hypothetical protein